MKRRTEKPSDSPMRFFTPELYVRFNSADDAEADVADAEWESAVAAYRRHLDGLRDRIPMQVRALADLCLHDAELLAVQQEIQPPQHFRARSNCRDIK